MKRPNNVKKLKKNNVWSRNELFMNISCFIFVPNILGNIKNIKKCKDEFFDLHISLNSIIIPNWLGWDWIE